MDAKTILVIFRSGSDRICRFEEKSTLSTLKMGQGFIERIVNKKGNNVAYMKNRFYLPLLLVFRET